MHSLARNQFCSTESADTTVYRHQIPKFAGPAMESIYGSLYSSLAVLQSSTSGDPRDTSTYVHWEPGKSAHCAQPRAIFLFRQQGQRIRVLNEGMRLDCEDIDRFCEHLLGMDPSVQSIEFHAISTQGTLIRSSRPYLRFACTEDIVIDLPDCAQRYMEQLGKSTSKSLKKRLSRAPRELPGFAHTLHHGRDVSEQAIRTIVSFNHARMAKKERRSAMSDKVINELLSLLRTHGTVGLLESEGTILAGTLACRFGDDVFSLVTAHDPSYDHLGLGSLSRHLMILAAIDSGARRFHLLGGQLRSKRSALGVRQRLSHWVVYRSKLAMLSDIPYMLKLAAASAVYHWQSWMDYQDAYHQHTWTSRTLNAARVLSRRFRTPLTGFGSA